MDEHARAGQSQIGGAQSGERRRASPRRHDRRVDQPEALQLGQILAGAPRRPTARLVLERGHRQGDPLPAPDAGEEGQWAPAQRVGQAQPAADQIGVDVGGAGGLGEQVAQMPHPALVDREPGGRDGPLNDLAARRPCTGPAGEEGVAAQRTAGAGQRDPVLDGERERRTGPHPFARHRQLRGLGRGRPEPRREPGVHLDGAAGFEDEGRGGAAHRARHGCPGLDQGTARGLVECGHAVILPERRHRSQHRRRRPHHSGSAAVSRTEHEVLPRATSGKPAAATVVPWPPRPARRS